MFDPLSPALWVHVVTAIAALVAGAFVLSLPKGTQLHRTLGLVYLLSLLGTVASSATAPATVMAIPGTRFGFFHFFVLLGGISLLLGIGALLRWRRTRSPAALRFHQVHLAYSYAGLVMAGFSQFATNPRFGLIDGLTIQQFWWSFGLINGAIYGVAAFLIQTRIAAVDPLRQLRDRASD